MRALEGRVVVVTGAGGGIGREHALLLASEGAAVVVNDLGGSSQGTGSDRSAAEGVVDEITGAGGQAVANADDVTDWDGGRRLVQTAIDTFGRLDVLVNNAGILRDSVIANLSEADWDAVVGVHLKGHFVPTRWAVQHWRERSKAGEEVKASLIHTSSTSGLLGNVGQANYAAAKAGIASFSTICAMELGRYGVRSNVVVPAARTRLTENAPGVRDIVKAPESADHFDPWHPGHISPVVAYLATANCPLNAATLFVRGGTVTVMDPWRMGEGVEQEERWSIEALAKVLPDIAPTAAPSR